jgi:acyl-CoA thioesterase-1
MRLPRRSAPYALAAALSACGGGAGNPAAPTTTATPEPAPTSRHAVSGVVFYDENQNGQLDEPEQVRLPGVAVTVGDRTVGSTADGTFELPDAPAGQRSVSVGVDSLPLFFTPGPPVSLSVPSPAGFRLAVPVALPIGTNHPNVFMAFGDSITEGDGSRGGQGYRITLASLLRGHWGGRAEVPEEGVSATKSDGGLARLPDALARVRPAYTLIHYGTNDWNSINCQHVWQCYTAPSMRQMVRVAKAANSVPVVATLIPANPDASASRRPADRNAWILETNVELRMVAAVEGAILADLHAMFAAEGPEESWGRFFSDHVHPNQAGYDLMAEGWYRAIVRARSAR